MTPIVAGVLAAAVVFLGSWVPSLWSDEVATKRVSSLSPTQLVTFAQHRDAVHALYYFLMHWWALVFGESAVSLRAPSALAVGASAAGLVVLGRRWSPRLGVFAAVVFVLLPRTLDSGQEARSYAIAACLATWATIALMRAIESQSQSQSQSQSRRRWIIYAVLLVITTYIFLYAWLLCVAHVVFLVTTHRWKSALRCIASGGAAAVLAVPLVVVAAGERGQIAWLATASPVNVWTVGVEPWFETAVGPLVIAVGALVFGAATRFRAIAETRAEAALLAVSLLVVPTVALILVNAFAGPMYTSRYLTFVSPGVALLIAIPLEQIRGKAVLAATLAVSCIVVAPSYATQRGPSGKNGSDLHRVAQVVRSLSDPGDAIIFARGKVLSQDPRYALYGYPTDFVGLRDPALTVRFPASRTISDTTLPAVSVARTKPLPPTVLIVIPGSSDNCLRDSLGRALRNRDYRLERHQTVSRDSVCKFTRAG